MLVDFRPHARLRSDRTPVTVGDSLGPVVDALSGSTTDLSRVRVVCDWVQYRENFREVVEVRPIVAGERAAGRSPVPEGAREDDLEIAVDVRRGADVALADLTRDALAAHAGGTADVGRVLLEDWGPTRRSCLWGFNALYWSALGLWEQATGRPYEQALPGGESDARNHAAAREVLTNLFTVWDGLADRHALPPELYVVELGVGNGTQARVFLDEFRALDAQRGRGYYRRLHYLMCDYSAHVLDLARATVAQHADHVSSFVLDATPTRRRAGLPALQGVPGLHLQRLRQPAHRRGRPHRRPDLFQVETPRVPAPCRRPRSSPRRWTPVPTRSASWPTAAAPRPRTARRGRCPRTSRPRGRGGVLAARLGRRCGSPNATCARRPGHVRDRPDVSGEPLRPLLESGADLRMHVNNGAVASFAETLPLLHPFGRLVCHDLFARDVGAYRTGFRGPGKYDGSVVNWVNGRLLAHLGRRRGFDVTFAPFAHRGGANIVTMTAQVRD